MCIKQLTAHNIRTLRQARGWTQEVLGELSGVHRNQIGRLERGNTDISLTMLERVAAGLDVEPSILITDTVLRVR